MTWTRPSLFDKPGQRNKGGEDRAVLDQIAELTAPGWTLFTPTWTGSVSNPVINNGTLSARWRWSTESDLVELEYYVLMGSTTTYGSGFYSFSWPSSPAPSASAQTALTGVALAVDVSAGNRFPCAIDIFSGAFVVAVPTGGLCSTTSPFTWATGDRLLINTRYEP